MPTYKVALEATVSTIVEVEADDPEHAEEVAFEQGIPSLMFTNHTYPDTGEWEPVEVWPVEP